MKGADLSSAPLEELIGREWLAVNGIGGFACSTLCGLNTRKYHGILVGTFAPPVRRMVLLSRVEETVKHNGWPAELACNEYPGTIHPEGHRLLRAFSARPFPRWVYQGDGWTVEKSLHLLQGQNTVVLSYTPLAAERRVEMELRPLFALRPIHELAYQWNGKLTPESYGGKQQHRIPPTVRTPEVFFAHDGDFTIEGHWYLSTIYRREEERGYAGLEDLWMPGVVRWTPVVGQTVHFVCSTEPIDSGRALEEVEAGQRAAMVSVGVSALGGALERARASAGRASRGAGEAVEELVRASAQFVATVPAGKGEAGEQARGRKTTVVITQYPWAPPSGRAALIAMPGLLLVTGRVEEAKSLLEGLLARMDGKGLVPSDFAEDGSGPVYRGADTSLWFVNAVYHYLRYSGDERGVRRRFWLAVKEIVRAYRDGTVGLGVQMNAEGLVSSRVAGAATSWMDAKVGDWVVTPRQGKCVELNALWYNVLRVAADLAERFDEHRLAGELTGLAGSVKEAFNRSFWNEAAGCCFDVVDGGAKDGAVRPNQLLAVSLPFAVLDMERQGAVVEKVRKELLTPVGVRTLAPSDPNYQGHYRGGVVARDRAMHQGTAYPWLLGALVSAYVRVNGRGEETRAEARKMVDGCLCYMREEGIGQICELFDGDAPHHGGGGIASALSVGEILRCWMEDVLDQGAPAAAGGAGAAPLSQDEPARVSVRQGA